MYILKGEAIPVTGCGGLWGCEMLRIPYYLDSRLTYGSEVVSFTRCDLVRLKGLDKLKRKRKKKLFTSSILGVEPATFWLVAYYLKQLHCRVPKIFYYINLIKNKNKLRGP
jgi:hypothetical protein